jgi:hypothetical protein
MRVKQGQEEEQTMQGEFTYFTLNPGFCFQYSIEARNEKALTCIRDLVFKMEQDIALIKATEFYNQVEQTFLNDNVKF